MKLPPIEYFYGKTPLSIWISNCKPFEPRKIDKSGIEIKYLEISNTYQAYINHHDTIIANVIAEMKEYFNMNRYLL